MIDSEVSKSVIGYHPLNERILYVRLRAKPINVTIFQVYVPTSVATEEEIVAFYGELENAIDSAHQQDIKIIMGFDVLLMRRVNALMLRWGVMFR